MVNQIIGEQIYTNKFNKHIYRGRNVLVAENGVGRLVVLSNA